MTQPANYKTQAGLLKALSRSSKKSMDVSLAWWFRSAEYCLVSRWGWAEQDAAKFVASYYPHTSKYRANS
jgi:hypothetical protein